MECHRYGVLEGHPVTDQHGVSHAELAHVLGSLEFESILARWTAEHHALDALARVEIACGEHDKALALVDDELAGARHHGVHKAVGRALALRGQALLAADRREEAEAALLEALHTAERIAYPKTAWQAHNLIAELKRRDGKVADADQHTRQSHAIVERIAQSLLRDDLRRTLRHSAGIP